MKWLFPLVMILLSSFGGAAAGWWLRPAPEAVAATEEASAQEASGEISYYKLPNQFVVPVVESGRVASVVLMSLTVQLRGETTEQVAFQEPKLRDEFLKVLFERANVGGFRGNFTGESQVAQLRQSLLEAGRLVLPGAIEDILITDLLRQDQ
ncbi:flagellar basal body-associated FliL family protein [Falsigemmobacter faecalis]|uniref:Flagellar protein FliL n=1 Tax=Falsigemmobacter faecalis TaxID=2488730 RepID=A0A3P3DJ55_9RHOB|nr:flagellar basal body-associated FliL family protein [Falsigemmobacter faecalis]RRH74291.1 flagellar basal body-associated protein FliL [Falsigemmobacter faecalis]